MSIQNLIAGSVAPQQNSLIDTFLTAQKIKAYRSRNALAEAKAAELPYERAREQALNEAYISKAQAQTGKAEAETNQSDAAYAMKMAEFVGRDPSNEQAVLGAFAFGAEKFPALQGIAAKLESLRGTPGFAQTAGQFAMSAKEKAAMQLGQDKFGEAQKQSAIDNTFQQGNLNVAQARLGVSQANAADMRRHRGVMENKPASGLSLGYDEQGRVVLGQGGMPKLTEAQGKATALSMRGGEASQQLNALEDGGYVPDTMTQMKQWAGEKTGSKNRYLDATGQKYEQALLNFGTAIGRFESGAAIPEPEWVRFVNQYAARPGSTPEEIAQKRQNRETAVAGMGVAAGPGRQAMPPSPNLPQIEAQEWHGATAGGMKYKVLP